MLWVLWKKIKGYLITGTQFFLAKSKCDTRTVEAKKAINNLHCYMCIQGYICLDLQDITHSIYIAGIISHKPFKFWKLNLVSKFFLWWKVFTALMIGCYFNCCHQVSLQKPYLTWQLSIPLWSVPAQSIVSGIVKVKRLVQSSCANSVIFALYRARVPWPPV